MLTVDELLDILRKMDEAGDVEPAKAIARQIARQTAGANGVAMPTPADITLPVDAPTPDLTGAEPEPQDFIGEIASLMTPRSPALAMRTQEAAVKAPAPVPLQQTGMGLQPARTYAPKPTPGLADVLSGKVTQPGAVDPVAEVLAAMTGAQRAEDFPPSRAPQSMMDMGVAAGLRNAAAQPVVPPGPAPADPTFLGAAKDMGQRLMRGGTEVAASQPEALAIASAMGDEARRADARVRLEQEALQLEAEADSLAVEIAKLPDVDAQAFALEEVAKLRGLAEQRRLLASTPSVAGAAPDADSRGMFRAGQAIRDASTGFFGTPDPARDAMLKSKVAEGAGNMLGMATTSLATGVVAGPVAATVTGAAIGSGMNVSSVYREAKQAGAAEQDALNASKWAAAVGASEIIPINRALKLLPSGLRDRIGGAFYRRVNEVLVGAGEEAAQEYVATVANNLIASGYYDPDRGWTEGAGQAALIGGILGGGMGAVGSFMGPQGDPAKGTPADPNANPPLPVVPPASPMGPVDQIAAAMAPPAADAVPAAPQSEQAVAPALAPPAPTQPAVDPAAQIAAAMTAPVAPVAPQSITRAEAEANPDRYEIVDEAEGQGADFRPTGAQVVIDKQTGQALPLAPATAAVPSPAVGAPSGREPAGQPQVDPSPPAAGPEAEILSAMTGQAAPAGPAPEADVVKAAGGVAPPQPASAPNQPRNFEFIDAAGVAQIGTEPDVMQYKAGGDTDGVTDRLKGVTEWRPERAGMSIIYEYADGRRVIADGHQRLGLAKRLAGQGKPIQMPAMILREVDGITPAEARTTAALKNIAEGSGTALDAAKVLRGSTENLQSLGLPPNSAIVRDATGMRALSDQAFGMVVNGVASERDGGIVGRVVTDQTAQANILGLLARMQKDRPITAFQAEQVARQAAADTVTETQDSLFGPEMDTKNLYLERAKILEAATKMARDEKRAFKNVLDNAERLQAAGNQLDADGNKARVDNAAAIGDYLAREANTKGAISEALTAAARALNGGTTLASATRQFLDAVERELAARGGERPSGDQGGQSPVPERQPEPEPQAVEPERDEDAALGDMFGGPAPAAPAPDPQADILAAMTGQVAKPAADLFGATPQTGKTPDQIKAEAEAKVRANQSKLRKPGGNDGDAGPLFGGDQGDMLAPKGETDGNRDTVSNTVSNAGSASKAPKTFATAAEWGQAVLDALTAKIRKTGSVQVVVSRQRVIDLNRPEQVAEGFRTNSNGIEVRSGKKWEQLGITEADALAAKLGLPSRFEAVPAVEKPATLSDAERIEAEAKRQGVTINDLGYRNILSGLPNKATDADIAAAVKEYATFDGSDVAKRADRFPTTLEAIAKGPTGSGRLTHIYAEYRGRRYYLASVPGNPDGPASEWRKTFPKASIFTTDRADGTSINGEVPELEAAIQAQFEADTADPSFATTIAELNRSRDAILAPFQGQALKNVLDAQPVGTADSMALMKAIAEADTIEQRYRAADAWVAQMGKKHDREYMVLFSKDGIPVSVTRGWVGSAATGYSVSPTTIALQAMEKTGAGYATHNHPVNSAMSPGDLRTLATGYASITAVGHDGAYHSAKPGENMPGLAMLARTRDDLAELQRLGDAITEIDTMLSSRFTHDYWEATGRNEPLSRIPNRAALNLFLHRLGLIKYSGDAQRVLDNLEMDFDGFFRTNRDAAIAAFRRAGFPVAEVSDPIGNRPAGIAGGVAEVGTGQEGPTGKPAGDGGASPALIKMGPPPKRGPAKTSNPALNGALDDIFGDDSDVSGPSDDLAGGGSDGPAADGVGNGDVSPAAGSSKRGTGGRGSKAGGRNGQPGADGGIPDGDAPAVGTRGNRRPDRPGGADRQPAAGGNGGRRNGGGTGRLPADPGGKADTAGNAAGSPAKLTAAQQLAAIRNVLKEDVIDFVASTSQASRTDTPAFRKWFGDSKVVGADGRPLVVYHGTRKGGFGVFNTDGGSKKTSGTGAFFTQTNLGASTYSGTKKEIVPLDVAAIVADPEAHGFSVVQDRGEWIATDPDGNDWASDDREQALTELADDYITSNSSQDGNYAVYLSIKNPKIIDAEGQNWDSIGGDDFDGMSTDEMVREAREEGYDGVIFENITDEGPFGQGYGWDDKVFVAFDPTQIKSTFNAGTWDATSPYMLREDAANPVDQHKYEALESIFLSGESLARIDLAKASDREVFRAIILPLKDDAGMTRDEVAELAPYLETFIANLRAGRVKLPESQTAIDKLNAIVPGWSGTNGMLTNADPVRGGIIDQNLADKKWFVILNGSARSVDGLDTRDQAADWFIQNYSQPAGVDRTELQRQADKVRVVLGDRANIDATLPLLLPEQRDDVAKVEARYAKPDGHGMMITNGTGTGKAQPLDAAILTPLGWRKMGDLAVGDKVISADGTATEVVGVYPQGEKPIYRVEFSDGAATECCDEHLWETQTLYARRKGRANPAWGCAQPQVRSLAEIRASLCAQHFVPVAAAIQHPARALPVRPYTLGVILGDGCLRGAGLTFSGHDQETADAVALELAGDFEVVRISEPRCPTWRIGDEQQKDHRGKFIPHRLIQSLRDVGLWGADSGAKFIPDDYLVSSAQDRTLLLQGLMDTDGTVDRRTGSVSFCTVSPGLADGVTALVRSLGGVATRTMTRKFYTHKGERREGQLAYILTMHLPNDIAPFRVSRKAALVRPKHHAPRRKIVSVSLVGAKPAQCIAVAHPRHLYVTDDYVLTHNTFSGGGVIKRFVQQGKGNILIVAPSEAVIAGWTWALEALNVPVSQLADTKDAGRGVVITTYANLNANDAVASRDWDLVVTDEAQNLMASAAGDVTGALRALRAITKWPEDFHQLVRMQNSEAIARLWPKEDGKKISRASDAVEAQRRALDDKMRKETDALRAKPPARSKVLFLSATPFAYDKTIDYAEGYLFSYPEDGRINGSNQSGRNLFMVQNFGYRIRYHKLTKPEHAVDSAVFEREFHEKLKREGALSGRSLQVDVDYDRRFVRKEDADGTRLDEALEALDALAQAEREQFNATVKAGQIGTRPDQPFSALQNHMRKNFDYLARQQLLEAIKAKLASEEIKKHLALGRKVVVFHDFNVGGGLNPFTHPKTKSVGIDEASGEEIRVPVSPMTAEAADGYRKLLEAHPWVASLNFTGYDAPVKHLPKALGKTVRLFNGTVPQKQRLQNLADFNTDGSGVDVLVVQADAGGAGISMHDTTGKHQRVLINLGMPTKPTTTLQQEGRILRVGSSSDAPFRYFTIGTTWERAAFAQRIAERSGTVENLALGNEARDMMNAFIDAYMEAADFAPSDQDGKGGKVKDSRAAAITPFQRAMTHYFGRPKISGRRDQRDGIDFYPTPEPLAFKMVEWAGIRANERVMEPSAGDGAIARYMPDDVALTLVEPSSDLGSTAQLRAPKGNMVQSRFENYNLVNKHHVIVMNPPFGAGGSTAMQHLAKAAKHLRPGGRIVALIPTGPSADKKFAAWWESDEAKGLNLSAEVQLPAVAFERAGTGVMTRVVIIDKPAPGQTLPMGQQNLNFAGANNITEFFDRLEQYEVRRRPDPVQDVIEELEAEGEDASTPVNGTRQGPPLASEIGSFAKTTVTSQKGKPFPAAYHAAKVERDVYDQMKEAAQAHMGWWHKNAGTPKGAGPTFAFRTEAQRDAFMADMQKPTTMGMEETPLRAEMTQQAAASTETIRDLMPALRAELDRLDLKRVRLAQSEGKPGWQGRFQVTGDGEIEIIIGASLDAVKTLHHEVIHALRAMNLFTAAEWQALTLAAERKWLAKHDIAARYPDLTKAEQIEEAIAEEFSEALAAKKAPKGSILITAFNKIARILRAFRNVLNGAGFQTTEDVFGRALSGEIGRRNAGNTGARAGMAFSRQPPVASLTGDELGKHDDIRSLGRAAEDWYRNNLVGQTVTNKATGMKIGFNRRGSRKVGGRKGEDLFRIVPALREILEGGILVDTQSDKMARDEVKAIHKISASIILAGGAKDVIATVREMRDGTFHYDLSMDSEAGGFSASTVQEQSRTSALEGDPATLNIQDLPPSFKEQRPPLAVRPLTPQARAHRNSAMGSTPFIPDRRVWETLTRAGMPIWQRLRDLPGAASDAVDRARYTIQDRMLPFLRAQEAVMRQTGRNLPKEHDAYVAETTFSGKVGRHLLEIDEEYTKPMIQIIAASKGRMDVESVGTWLYARHAIERNRYIASINPMMPDGGSGMLDADAQQILADMAATQDAAAYLQIGALIDALRERNLKLREDAGLISAKEANLWRTQYKHYVPMKGFEETDHYESMMDLQGVRTGRRYSTRGQETRRALGRQSEAFNPLQSAITQAQEVAIRAEKNRVAQAMHELATNYPSKALWEVKKPKQKRYFNRTTGLVETRVEDPVSMVLEPNEMAVKIKGEEHRILFNDQRLAESAGTLGADQMGGLLRTLSMFSRFFSMTRTMLNPEFMVTNAFRDFQTAQFNIQAFGENDKLRIAAAMAKNWHKAFLGAMRGSTYRFDTEWSKYYREFQKAGAQVWFWTMEQPEAAREDLSRRIGLARGNRAQRMLKVMSSPSAFFSFRDNAALNFIERTNMAVDNAIRLAAFVEARRAGWDVEKAAFLAKELTVNFNRRGEAGAQMNALYPFFNAAVQGSVRTLKALSSRRVAMMVLTAFAAGALNDMLNAALSEEDDDGELLYDKVADFRNERNFHLVLWGTDDSPFAIPMPYGYNLFPYAGQQLGKVMRGVKPADEAFGDVVKAAFGAFSPMNAATPAQLVSPFIADPLVEMAENKNWLGIPIYPEDYGNQSEPDAYVHFKGATEVSKWVAQTLNSLTGGDFRESGAIDVSPETLDHLAVFVTGSAGAFWGRTTDIAAKALSGDFESIETRSIPFVRNLTSPVGDWADRDRFYRFSAEVKNAQADKKGYEEAGVPVPPKTAALARLYDAYLAANREISGKGKWNPSKIGSLAAREQSKVHLDFNGKYLRVMGKQGE